MICPAYSTPEFLLITPDTPSLIYYSHLSGILVALLIGLFMYFKSRNSLIGKVLLWMSVIFSFHVFSSLVQWTGNSSDIIFFMWSLFIITYVLICLAVLYLFYVFVDKKDVSLSHKIIFLLILLPTAVLASSKYNLEEFNLIACGANDQFNFLTYYIDAVEIGIFFWVLALAFSRYKKVEKEAKIQFLLMTVGVVFFLLSFSATSNLALYLVTHGFTQDYDMEQYGYFGMTVFMGIIAYLATRYKTFNVKVVGIQLILVSLMIIIGLQIVFMENLSDKIMSTVTLLFLLLFGWFTISIQIEIKKKEDLQKLANRLEAANVELKRLDQAKSTFLNISSHQLRTPISVIKGVASMLFEGDLENAPPEERKRFYQSILLKSQKLESIIHDILNATSLTARKYKVKDKEIELINLRGLIEEILRDFELEIKERELKVDFLPNKENIPEIEGQKEYIREAIVNIITNAIKYTPSSKKTNDVRIERKEQGIINISLEKDAGDKNNVLIKISDNGIGIPKKDLSKIFRRFYRGENATDMYTDGTGIGLFVVKEIIKGHGGKIWAESTPEKGSTFFVTLPIHHKQGVDVEKYIFDK